MHQTFGQNLRRCRRNTRVPGTGGYLTQEEFAYQLQLRLRTQDSPQAQMISYWENDKHLPSANKDRNVLMAIVGVLFEYGGLASVREANMLLESGGYAPLTREEQTTLDQSSLQIEEIPMNPYITGRPVAAREMFFGRQDVFEFIRRNLIGQYQDNAIVLYGAPRTGKTSVLKQMHYNLGQSHVCVYIDLEGMALDGIGKFLWQVADAIWRTLQAEKIKLEQPLALEFTREQDPRHYFAEVFLKRVEEVLKERRLLLMFDEAMCLQDAVRAGKLEGDIFPYLSHLLQHHPVVNFVFCIGSHPRKVAPEFAQAFRAALNKEIGFLERETALELITRPVKGMFEYSQATTDAIYRLTSGHPYFIQLICHSLFNRWQEQRKERLEVGDVQAVLDEVVETGQLYMLNIWGSLTTEEKAVLAALARTITEESKATRQDVVRVLEAYDMRLAPGQVTSALESLSEAHIIYRDEPHFFRVDLFRRWIRDHKKVEWVKEDISAKVSVAEREAVEHPEELHRRYLQYVQDNWPIRKSNTVLLQAGNGLGLSFETRQIVTGVTAEAEVGSTIFSMVLHTLSLLSEVIHGHLAQAFQLAVLVWDGFK